jgi:hypothetical protein
MYMPPTAELQFTDLEDASLRWKRYLKLVFAIECGTIETKRNEGIGFSVSEDSRGSTLSSIRTRRLDCFKPRWQ